MPEQEVSPIYWIVNRRSDKGIGTYFRNAEEAEEAALAQSKICKSAVGIHSDKDGMIGLAVDGTLL